jgi:hypothetical protein
MCQSGKADLGTQHSHLKITGLIEVTDSDWGFYTGGSAGQALAFFFLVLIREFHINRFGLPEFKP